MDIHLIIKLGEGDHLSKRNNSFLAHFCLWRQKAYIDWLFAKGTLPFTPILHQALNMENMLTNADTATVKIKQGKHVKRCWIHIPEPEYLFLFCAWLTANRARLFIWF